MSESKSTASCRLAIMNYGYSIRNLCTESCRNDGAYVIGVGARMTLVFSYCCRRVVCNSLSFINFYAIRSESLLDNCGVCFCKRIVRQTRK